MGGKTILAIDPGNEQSAYVLISGDYMPLDFAKVENEYLLNTVLEFVNSSADTIVIEMIGHYGSGMPVGKTVFDTCIWIGRYMQKVQHMELETILRPTIKANLCGSSRAKDSNVIQALKDRFGDKGTKKNPGWFYGFSKDVWQAYAVGVTYLDQYYQNKVGGTD